MNKGELIQAVVAASGLTKKDSAAAVDAVFAAITDAMKKGDKVSLIGFGTFGVKDRPAREAIKPGHPGEKIQIAACKAPYFKAGKALKDEVNK